MHVYLCMTCVPNIQREQKRGIDLLELKFQIVLSLHVGTRNWIQVLYKSIKFSLIIEPNLQLQAYIVIHIDKTTVSSIILAFENITKNFKKIFESCCFSLLLPDSIVLQRILCLIISLFIYYSLGLYNSSTIIISLIVIL